MPGELTRAEPPTIGGGARLETLWQALSSRMNFAGRSPRRAPLGARDEELANA